MPFFQSHTHGPFSYTGTYALDTSAEYDMIVHLSAQGEDSRADSALYVAFEALVNQIVALGGDAAINVSIKSTSSGRKCVTVITATAVKTHS